MQPPATSLADRSGRLALFGGLAVVVGCGLTLVALLYVALPFTGILRESSVPWRGIVTGALTYLLLGAIFICAGVGSILKRRWVRAVMLVLAWSWLLTGALMFLLCALLLDEVLTAAASQGPVLPPEVQTTVQRVVLTALGFGGLALPALFIAVYRDRALLLTCERANPERGWTDRCPVSVLGLSLGMAAAALFTLPTILHPVVPLFGVIVVGWPGAVLTVAAAAACAVLALSTFRLEKRGWWGTTLLMVLMGASAAVTFAVADPELLFDAIAQSGGRELGLTGSGPALAWASIAFTVLSVFYMLGIRRHFPFGGR